VDHEIIAESDLEAGRRPGSAGSAGVARLEEGLTNQDLADLVDFIFTDLR
jgi:hypothetical protein